LEDAMKKYFNHQTKKALKVQNLITIESLDVSEDFSYPEEVHDFFEFVYVDSGNIICSCEDAVIELNQGDFFLIPPEKKHFYESLKKSSASIFIVCFRCKSEIISLLNKKTRLNKEAKSIILDIVSESKNAFTFPFKKKLKISDSPLFGAQQLVESNIEKLLIHLVREEMSAGGSVRLVMNSMELENNLVNDLISILKSNVYARISLDRICQQTYYSKTFLNCIFKKNTSHSIMQYYNILKINEAKKLLRENIPANEIATRLNFDSATYFTKVFKKYAKMTPSEYKKTVL
jgi:AraC-like DNA-binding protein